MQLNPDKAVVEKIGDFAILGSRLSGVTVVKSTGDLVEKMRILEAEVRSTDDIEELRDIPVFRSYRDFFWATGIDPTKTRPASEALTRRILRGRQLPHINTFVDSLNMSSVRTRIPFAAFDSDLLEGPLVLELCRAVCPSPGCNVEAMLDARCRPRRQVDDIRRSETTQGREHLLTQHADIGHVLCLAHAVDLILGREPRVDQCGHRTLGEIAEGRHGDEILLAAPDRRPTRGTRQKECAGEGDHGGGNSANPATRPGNDCLRLH